MNQTRTQTAPPASPDLSSDPTSPAPTATEACPPAATDAGNIVTTPAKPLPGNSGSVSSPNQPLTFTNSERQPVRYCEYSECRAKLVIKRPKNFKPKRFCNARCRRRHFYELHKR